MSRSTTRAWWAPGPDGLSWRSKLGTGGVATALALVSAAVWWSPGGDEPTATTPVVQAAERSATEAEVNDARLDDLRRALVERDRAAADSRQRQEPPVEPGADDGAADEQEEAAPAPRSGDDGARERPRERRTPAPRARSAPPSADSPGAANPRNPVLPDRADVPPPPAPSPPPVTPAPAPAPAPTPPAPEPVTAPTKAELLEPDLRYYGMYTVQSPFSWSELDDVSNRTGRLPDVAGYFSGWDKEFRDDAVTRAWSRGMLPLLTWESRPSGSANNERTEADYSLPLILGDADAGVPGAYDEYLRRYAQDVAELGLPLAIRLNHEMNGDWYPWSEMDKAGKPINGNRPGDFAAVWRHVHDIFDEEGAGDLVIWVWAPNITNNLPELLRGQDALERLYPGDEYVDWVGLSGYFRPPYREDQTPTFEYTFDRTLGQLRELTDKPIFLAEVAASEVGGQKADWVRSFFDGLAQPENDDVIGFAWFSLTITSTVRGELVTNDWRVNSHRLSLEAFVEGLRDPAARIGGIPYGPNPSTPSVPDPRPVTGSGDEAEEPPPDTTVAAVADPLDGSRPSDEAPSEPGVVESAESSPTAAPVGSGAG